MKKCILIFDDDQEILFACKIILERGNFRLETRTSCDNIIADIIQIKPGIILMDLWIPEIGGENAINMMKNNKDTQHIPIILFSANAEIEEICSRANANGFLRKPFEIATLLHMIENNIPVMI
jgi:DNA-binding NtrC family response regulator